MLEVFSRIALFQLETLASVRSGIYSLQPRCVAAMARRGQVMCMGRAARAGDVVMTHRHTGQDLPRVQLLTERAFATVERFMHIQASSGIVLLVAAAIALIWANSTFAP